MAPKYFHRRWGISPRPENLYGDYHQQSSIGYSGTAVTRLRLGVGTAIPIRAMQQVEHLIYRDFLPRDRGKSGHGWPIGARNQMLNRSNGNYRRWNCYSC